MNRKRHSLGYSIKCVSRDQLEFIYQIRNHVRALMEEKMDHRPRDYIWFCCGGYPGICYNDYTTMNFNNLDFYIVSYKRNYDYLQKPLVFYKFLYDRWYAKFIIVSFADREISDYTNLACTFLRNLYTPAFQYALVREGSLVLRLTDTPDAIQENNIYIAEDRIQRTAEPDQEYLDPGDFVSLPQSRMDCTKFEEIFTSNVETPDMPKLFHILETIGASYWHCDLIESRLYRKYQK